MDIEYMWPGSVHNAKVYAKLSINEKQVTFIVSNVDSLCKGQYLPIEFR